MAKVLSGFNSVEEKAEYIRAIIETIKEFKNPNVRAVSVIEPLLDIKTADEAYVHFGKEGFTKSESDSLYDVLDNTVPGTKKGDVDTVVAFLNQKHDEIVAARTPGPINNNNNNANAGAKNVYKVTKRSLYNPTGKSSFKRGLARIRVEIQQQVALFVQLMGQLYPDVEKCKAAFVPYLLVFPKSWREELVKIAQDENMTPDELRKPVYADNKALGHFRVENAGTTATVAFTYANTSGTDLPSPSQVVAMMIGYGIIHLGPEYVWCPAYVHAIGVKIGDDIREADTVSVQTGLVNHAIIIAEIVIKSNWPDPKKKKFLAQFIAGIRYGLARAASGKTNAANHRNQSADIAKAIGIFQEQAGDTMVELFAMQEYKKYEPTDAEIKDEMAKIKAVDGKRGAYSKHAPKPVINDIDDSIVLLVPELKDEAERRKKAKSGQVV